MIAEMLKKYKESGKDFAQIAKDTGVNPTYINKMQNGWENYKLADESKRAAEEKVLNYLRSLELFKEHLNDLSDEFVEARKREYKEICDASGILMFQNTVNIIATVIKTAKQKALVKICGASGSGKTTAIKAVMKKVPQMVCVTVCEGMGTKWFLRELAIEIGVKTLPRTSEELMRAIKKELSVNKKIVAIDEANFLCAASLEQLRHIHDVCETTMILIGTEKLDTTIDESHPQVSTRIRDSLPVRPVGISEVCLMASSYGVDISEAMARRLLSKCKNLRVVMVFLDYFYEKYAFDLGRFDDALASFNVR